MNAVMEFQSFRITNVGYEVKNLDKNDNSQIKDASLRINVGTSNIENEGAQLELEVIVEDGNDSYERSIKVVILGLFKFQAQGIKDEESEELLRVNGTAIMMPYIRSLISSLTGFDNSTEHVLLPTINVNAIFED